MTDTLERIRIALQGRYAVEREVGRGGMAVVFLARDEKHQRRVAVKVLRPELSAAVGPSRFLREIEIAAHLSHPHILALHDSGETEGLLYYIMPYVEGDTLRSRLSRERRLSIDDAIRVATAVARALDYAGRRGVVHRDIKPENILFNDGEPVLTDFGIAYAASSGDVRLTELGLSIGTPEYMSPEQCMGDGVDGRSDIYSLGCVLYEMLSGSPPFTGGSSSMIASRHLTEPVPSIARERPDTPPHLASAVSRALAKSPAERFASAGEFAAALARPVAVARADDARALVVLPFANLSPDPDNEFFSDGLTEELIADLSRIQALRVISRTSAMHFKGTTKDLRTIAAELNVRYVLEGSVRRAGNAVRITAQLIDAVDDAHLWAEKFSGTVDDVFEIQERVSKSISDALQIKLTPRENREIGSRPFADVRAYELYLRARQAMWQFTAESASLSVELLAGAEKISGPNAVLESGLAGAHFVLSRTVTAGVEEHVRRCKAHAMRTIDLDPHSAEGHTWLGVARFKEHYGFVEGARHLLTGFSLNRSDFSNLRAIGWYFAEAGHLTVAEACVNRLLAIDPFSPMAHCTAGLVHQMKGDPEQAAKMLARSVELAPDGPIFARQYARVLAELGRTDEAAKHLAWIANHRPDEPFSRLARFYLHTLRGERDAAMSCLTTGLRAIGKSDETQCWFVAEGLARIGEYDAAIDWLGEAAKYGFVNYPFLSEGDPFLSDLRGRPRFVEFLHGVRQTWILFRESAGEVPEAKEMA